MNESLLPRLASPDTGGPLTLTVTRRRGEDILEGFLTDAAGHRYPIEDGIPRLLPGALLDAQKSEMAARDAQVKDYDRMAFLHLFGRVEIPLDPARPGRPARRPPAGSRLRHGPDDAPARPGDARPGRHGLLAESLRVNRKKLRGDGLGHIPLVQADLCHLPFAAGVFDRVVSCQVLEHVPGDAARRQAVAELARVVRPGGTLALSAYKHSLLTRAFAEKEGQHDGGIPFFRFTRRELRALLATAFEVQSITGVLVYIYLARCRKRTNPIAVRSLPNGLG